MSGGEWFRRHVDDHLRALADVDGRCGAAFQIRVERRVQAVVVHTARALGHVVCGDDDVAWLQAWVRAVLQDRPAQGCRASRKETARSKSVQNILGVPESALHEP